jgi:drug/metabolite transporter (DMT)-like permease
MTAAAIPLKIKLALASTVILWASAFVGIRAGLLGYTPGALALFRFLVASVAIYVIYLRLPRRNKIASKDVILMLLTGALTIATYHIALNYGEIVVPSGTASFIISQIPIITTVIAIIFLKERLAATGVLGMSISIFGVMLIMLSSNNHFSFQIENIYLLIAALMGSIYNILQKPFLKKYHAIEVTAFMMWGATLPLTFFFPDLIKQIPHASFMATGSTIYLGIFPAAIAYATWCYALNVMSASRAANFLYFMPVGSTLLGWLLLGEIPAWTALLGGFIALSGLWIVNQSYHWQAKRKPTLIVLPAPD